MYAFHGFDKKLIGPGLKIHQKAEIFFRGLFAAGCDTQTAGHIYSNRFGHKDMHTRLDAGGPACAACHTAGSVGNLGGQGLGPDLTSTFQDLGGEAGLTGWLAAPPAPTMQPLYADRPLTEAEVADLIAFLGDAADQSQPDPGYDRFLVAGLGGLASLIAGMALAWRGMRQTYVERLRSRPGGRRRRGPRGGTRTSTGGRPRSGSTPTPRSERSHEPAPAGGSNR